MSKNQIPNVSLNALRYADKLSNQNIDYQKEVNRQKADLRRLNRKCRKLNKKYEHSQDRCKVLLSAGLITGLSVICIIGSAFRLARR